jgi:hypothetical protein
MRNLMELLIICLVLSIQVFATNKYLGLAKAGDSTGSSWTNMQSYSSANAFKRPDNSALVGGDSVFFDGHTDSVVYAPLSILNVRPFSGRAVITKGKDTRHNGEVIFSLTATTEDGYALQLVHCINTTVTGLTIRIKASGCTNSTPFKPNWALYMTYWYASPIDEMNGIIIDNCHITSNGWGSLINLEAQTGTSITNCLLDIPYNNTQSEQDCIDIKYGSGGGYTITNNTIHIVGSLQAPDQHHSEVIQWWGGHTALKNNYETKIANNFITFFCQSAGFGPGIFLFSEVPGNRFLIYNNIIVMKNAVGSDAQKMITICPVLTGEGTDGQDTSYNISLRLYNNTIVNGDSHGYGLWLEYVDTLIIKNNIFMNLGDSAATPFNYSRGSLGSTAYKDIDYNLYYQHPFAGSSLLMFTDSVNSVNWAGWQALYNTGGVHIDAHSTTGTASFANLWGTNAVDYKLVPGSKGIDQGTTITLTSPDIVGTVRSGIYDDGAIEYNSVYHNLTLDADPSNGGTVSPSGVTSQLENSNVSITATPNSGYHFVSWTTDTPPNLVSTDNPYMVGMDVDYYFTAQFAINKVAVPTLFSPTSGTTGTDSALALLWQVDTGAVSYRLQVSVSSGFSSGVVFDEAGLSGGMAKVVSGLSYGTEYYWRVNATNTAGTSDWSSIWNFTTSSTPMQLPTVPVLIFPANGQTNQPLTTTFVWGSIGASSYTITIQHQITNGRSTANVIDIIATVSTNSFTYNLPSIGTQYFWSVTATNTAGTSLPSVTKSFGSLVCH